MLNKLVISIIQTIMTYEFDLTHCIHCSIMTNRIFKERLDFSNIENSVAIWGFNGILQPKDVNKTTFPLLVKASFMDG